MSWEYSQSTGELSHNGMVITRGYSGVQGFCQNNPFCEWISNYGPIPRGEWRIGAPHNTKTHGPHVMALTPVGHFGYGRSGFLIHGDKIKKPGTASQGCIILGPDIRQRISNSHDTTLFVVL